LFVVGITTPINNIDSLASHLPRIFYWLQQSSLDYWTTLTSLNRYQLIYPINAHIQALWLFSLGQNENLFFLVQWFSLVGIAASTFEISKSLNFSTTQALFSTLVGLSLPVVVLQTFSFQGDLTVTALLMVFIAFFFNFYLTKKIKFLWFAILSLLIALGTKQTAFFILPAACLVTLLVLVKDKGVTKFFRYSWLLLVLAILFSSYQYILNIVQTGSVFGLDSVLNEKYPSISRISDKATYLIPRFTYQFMGVEGLPRSIQPTLTHIKENIFTAILQPSGLNLEKKVFLQSGYDENESFQYQAIARLSEDTAWFGPFAILFIPLSTILSFFSKNNLRRNYAIICFINSIFYLFLVIIQRPGWDPYQGRYFILSLFPFIPLVSMLLSKKVIFRGIVIGIFLPISLLLIINTILLNDSKPIITARTQNDIINNFINPLPENSGIQKFLKKTLLKLTYPTPYSSQLVNIYEATYYDRLFFSSLYSVKDIEFVNKILPEGEPLSILITRSPIEYALFGKNRSRIVNPIAEISDARQGYVLVSNSLALSPPSNMKLLGKNSSYSIYFVGTN
jgi:4-amino-4-deoxy-L-arabinose transferase-like glycosyltransferase